VSQGRVITGKKEDVLVNDVAVRVDGFVSRDLNLNSGLGMTGKVLVDLNNVGVKYEERQVCAICLTRF